MPTIVVDVMPKSELLQVESDERHDGTGNNRRHELVDPRHTRSVHNDTDEGEQHTNSDDPGERRAGAADRDSGRDRCDKCKR